MNKKCLEENYFYINYYSYSLLLCYRHYCDYIYYICTIYTVHGTITDYPQFNLFGYDENMAHKEQFLPSDLVMVHFKHHLHPVLGILVTNL